MCTRLNHLINANIMSSLNIPLFNKSLKKHPKMVLWLTLSGSNYSCLEQISMVPKCSSHWRFVCRNFGRVKRRISVELCQTCHYKTLCRKQSMCSSCQNGHWSPYERRRPRTAYTSVHSIQDPCFHQLFLRYLSFLHAYSKSHDQAAQTDLCLYFKHLF